MAQTHDHVFDGGSARAERGTWLVMGITAAAMVLEIGAGWWFNSMALLADGWHMSTHALAIGLSALAYGAARRYARDPRFAFGSWKIEVLAGFASAIFLLGVAALMVVGSVERLLDPQPIRYREALLVAAIGLAVNLVSAWILHDADGHAHHHGHHHGHGHGHAHGHDVEHGHDHGHAHDHDHDHNQPAASPAAGHTHRAHHDLNLRSAYLHVLADAATSVLAIAALAGGWWLGWQWLDPVIGIAGAVLVAVWARGLIGDTSRVLLDREMDHPVVDAVRRAVLADDPQTRITDLHVWRVGRSAYSCALALSTEDTRLTPAHVRARLTACREVVHTTIEIEQAGTSTAPHR